MNTEITIKNVQLIRSGYSPRGFTSAGTLLSIPSNTKSKHTVVKYLGARIGRVDNLYYSDLRNGQVELHCNITFIGSLTMLSEMLKDKALYPVCVINDTANNAWLSEIFFAPAEDREFDEQEPINLASLLDLASLIVKSEAPAEPQGDTPYIYAPGMSKEDVLAWIKDVYNNALSANREERELQDLKDRSHAVERLLADKEKFLTEAIRN